MGLFFGGPFSKNSKKATEYEYNKRGGIRSRILSLLSGSWNEKKKKIAELDNALLPSLDSGGTTSSDDGIDAAESKETFDRLRKDEENLSLTDDDIAMAEKEVNKEI